MNPEVLSQVSHLRERCDKVGNDLAQLEQQCNDLVEDWEATVNRFNSLCSVAREYDFETVLLAEVAPVEEQIDARSNSLIAEMDQIEVQATNVVDAIEDVNLEEVLQETTGQANDFCDDMLEVARSLPDQVDSLVIDAVVVPSVEDVETRMSEVTNVVDGKVESVAELHEQWTNRVQTAFVELRDALDLSLSDDVLQSWSSQLDDLCTAFAESLGGFESRCENTTANFERIMNGLEHVTSDFNSVRSSVSESASSASSGLTLVAEIFQDVQSILEEVE